MYQALFKKMKIYQSSCSHGAYFIVRRKDNKWAIYSKPGYNK